MMAWGQDEMEVMSMIDFVLVKRDVDICAWCEDNARIRGMGWATSDQAVVYYVVNLVGK